MQSLTALPRPSRCIGARGHATIAASLAAVGMPRRLRRSRRLAAPLFGTFRALQAHMRGLPVLWAALGVAALAVGSGAQVRVPSVQPR